MIDYSLKLDFPTTNNEAEYKALIAGLGLARSVRAKNHKVCGDSRLVVSQVNGEFEAKDDIMAKYLRVVKGILTRFDDNRLLNSSTASGASPLGAFEFGKALEIGLMLQKLISKKIINNVVGHCLTADAAGGGYMFLGDDFVPQRQLKWVSMLNIPTTNLYVAEVSKISYGNNKLSLNGLDN
ncbi:hypothetical protein AgCh_038739 [Apium graveolens]